MNILVVNGHPSKHSLSAKIAEVFAQTSNAKLIHLSDLKFDPILHEGYREIQELEPDLKTMQQLIQDSDFLVIVTPVWWGSVPALLKGFLDRTFLPGFAFKYRKGSDLWDKLLTGKQAQLIVLSDGPTWWNNLIYGDPIIKMLKRSVLEFCGYKVKITKFGSIKKLSEKEIDRIFLKVKKIATSISSLTN